MFYGAGPREDEGERWTEPALKRPSAYARAEASTRQVLMMVSLGVAALVVGKLLESQIYLGASDTLGEVQSDAGALAVTWVFGRLWLWLVLPAFAFLAARFLSVGGVQFAVVGGLSGEAFLMLMDLARGGAEFAFPSTLETLLRFATLGVGVGLAALAGRKGEQLGGRGAGASARRGRTDQGQLRRHAGARGGGHAEVGAVGGPCGRGSVGDAPLG